MLLSGEQKATPGLRTNRYIRSHTVLVGVLEGLAIALVYPGCWISRNPLGANVAVGC